MCDRQLHKLLIFYLIFHHILMTFFALSERIVLFTTPSLIEIILMLDKFPGNERLRIEIVSSVFIC